MDKLEYRFLEQNQKGCLPSTYATHLQAEFVQDNNAYASLFYLTEQPDPDHAELIVYFKLMLQQHLTDVKLISQFLGVSEIVKYL